MADALYSINVDQSATGTSARTILQLVMATGTTGRLVDFAMTFDGTTSTATPVLVQLMRQTSAGTSSSVTPVKLDPNDTATSATAGKTFTSTDPTASDVLYEWRIPPTSGIVMQFPLGREVLIRGGGRLGLVVTAAATVNATAQMTWAE